MTGYWIDGWGGAPGGLFRRPMPPELALAGIDASLEVANRYIRVVYLPAIMDASSLRRRKAAWLSYRSPNGADAPSCRQSTWLNA